MDVCAQIMINEGGAVHFNANKNSRRLINGDIIQVFDAAAIGALQGQNYIPHEPVGSQRLGFLFVTGIPDGFVTFDDINRVLQKSHETVDDVLAVRDWTIDLNGLTNKELSDLFADKYVTVNYQKLKNTCFTKEQARNLQDSDLWQS